MCRNLFLALLLTPLFLFAQDQEMKVYSSGAYANRPLFYTSLLTEEEVENVIMLFSAISKYPVTSIDMEPPLLLDNRLRITICSGYVMVFEAQTCEGGEYHFLQKNLSDEWEMAPEPATRWYMN